MAGLIIGAGVGLAIDYAIGRHAAPFTWKNYRRDWWVTFAACAVPLVGVCAFAGYTIDVVRT